MSQTIIETNHLTKQFGSRIAVNNLDIQVTQGEVYGFLGPNGAGKTTTIRMLLGLSRPTRGSIHIFGKDMKKEKLSVLKKVGSLVENPSYYGHLTAVENLEAIRILLNAPKSRIEEVLSMVRLDKDANRPVKKFSLGMKQRLGIAAALLGKPKLLILDEPTNGLDPSGIIEIRELIKSMPKEHGVTIVVSSHLLSEIDQMATQVGIISNGTMIFQDSITALRKRAKSRIRLTVSEAESARKKLLSLGYPASFSDNRIYIENRSDQKVAEIVRQLVHEHYSVYRVEEERKSLEEIFLRLINGKGNQ